MSKGLDALKRLFIKIKHYDSLDEKVMLENDYSVIEKELKERDEFEVKYAKTHTALCKLREENSKKEQALKIIKEKKVDISGLFVCFDDFKNNDIEGCRRYNEEYVGCLHKYNELTQEEFDLLKEVLYGKETS